MAKRIFANNHQHYPAQIKKLMQSNALTQLFARMFSALLFRTLLFSTLLTSTGWAAEPSTDSPTNTAPTPTVQAQISQQVKQFVDSVSHKQRYARIEYDLMLPDTRLKLETCQAPLVIENRSPHRIIGRLTLKVACDKASKPWMVNLSVNIVAYDKIIVSSRPIPKGSKITAGMLTQVERNVTNMHQGYFKALHHVVGSVTKYAINGNRALKPGNILPPMLVNKGEKVVIHAKSSGLNIRATGIALDDGALGELVKVKNSQTTRIIEGRVSAAGQITVSL